MRTSPEITTQPPSFPSSRNQFTSGVSAENLSRRWTTECPSGSIIEWRARACLTARQLSRKSLTRRVFLQTQSHLELLRDPLHTTRQLHELTWQRSRPRGE